MQTQIAMITLKDIETDFLIEELKKRGYIHVFWQRDDIDDTIIKLGFKPSEEAISAIVEDIEHYFDASVGVNWDTIGVYVYEYFKPRKQDG